jgi:hypothetical protein
MDRRGWKMAFIEKAKYVADLARELAAMARRLNLDQSAHILEVAVISLEEEERERAGCVSLQPHAPKTHKASRPSH